jgi:hypothetical protein
MRIKIRKLNIKISKKETFKNRHHTVHVENADLISKMIKKAKISRVRDSDTRYFGLGL